MEKKCGRNSVGKRVAYPRRVILGHNKNPQPRIGFGLCVHFLGGKKYLRIDGMALWFRIMQTRHSFVSRLFQFPIKAGWWYFFREKTYKRTRLTQSTGMTRGKKERRRGKKKREKKNTAFPLSSFPPARRVCVYSYMTCEKSLPSSSSAVCASILPFFYLPA